MAFQFQSALTVLFNTGIEYRNPICEPKHEADALQGIQDVW